MKKDDKKIINEINRLNELMGLNKKLLNEQAWVDDLLTGLIQAGAKQGDEITTLTARLSDNALTTLEKADALEDIIRIAQREGNDDLLRVVNTQLVRSGGSLMNQLDNIIVNNRTLIQSGIDRGASKSDLQKIFVDDFNPNTGDDILDELIKRQLRTKVGKEYDELISTADDITSTTTRVTDDATETGARETSDDAAETGARESSTVSDDLSEQIPNTNSTELSDGSKISDIFNTDNWSNKKLISLSDEEINKVLDQEWFSKFMEKINNLFKITDDRLIKIQRIAKTIETTTNSQLKSRLQKKLKDELEWLYKKSTNNFVYMRDYLETISNTNLSWRRQWNTIKGGSDDGWDFYKTFGSIAEYNSGFKQFWAGLTDDIKSVTKFSNKYSMNPYKLVTKTTPDEIKNAIKNNLTNVFKSGTKRGFPKMTNEAYKALIKKYGPKSAKVAYYRDLVLSVLKFNILLSIIPVMGGALASFKLRDPVKACLATNDTNSEECKSIQDTWIERFFLSWAFSYRGIDEIDEYKNPLIELFKSVIPFANDSKVDMNDEGYLLALEFASLDPGFYGNIVNSFFEVLELISDPEDQDKFNEGLKKEMDKLNDKLEDATQKIENTLEEEGIDVSQTDDEDSTPESSGEPGSLDDFRKQLGVEENQVSQEGEFFIWDGDKYKWNGTDYEWVP